MQNSPYFCPEAEKRPHIRLRQAGSSSDSQRKTCWKEPGKWTSLMYRALLLELRNVYGSVRNISSRFSSQVCWASVLPIQNMPLACHCVLLFFFQLRNIIFSKIKLKTEEEIIISHHLLREYKLKSCALFFKLLAALLSVQEITFRLFCLFSQC